VYVRCVRDAIQHKVEWIGASFVQTLEDLISIRSFLPATNVPQLMAKIEKQQAVDNLKDLISGADGLMVARGDLGVEIDIAEVPVVQKRIVRSANANARAVVIATQMLESMVFRPRPSRAEVTDVANAILDGGDAVMLSNETAIGQFPVEAVNMLRRVIHVVEREYPYGTSATRFGRHVAARSEESISSIACQLSLELNAKAIVVPVETLQEAARITQYRPKTPVLAITDNPFLQMQLALVWGVVPLLGAPQVISACVDQAREWLDSWSQIKPGDSIVVIRTTRPDQGFADTLQVVQL